MSEFKKGDKVKVIAADVDDIKIHNVNNGDVLKVGFPHCGGAKVITKDGSTRTMHSCQLQLITSKNTSDMKDRLQLLQDYAIAGENTWLASQLNILKSEIEIHTLEKELELIDEIQSNS